jgi:hypothetical protein
MPFGLWKSKWEIHREDMARHREESERRSVEHRKQMERDRKESEKRSAEHDAKMEREREKTERFFAEMRAERVKSDERWLEVREECRELRAQHDVELAESRKSTQEALARIDETGKNIEASLQMMTREMAGMRKEVHESTDSVKAQTQAIFTLLDRFGDTGEPPARGPRLV